LTTKWTKDTKGVMGVLYGGVGGHRQDESEVGNTITGSTEEFVHGTNGIARKGEGHALPRRCRRAVSLSWGIHRTSAECCILGPRSVVEIMSRIRKRAPATTATNRRSRANLNAGATAAVDEPLDVQARYAEACRLASQGEHEEARRLYSDLEVSLSGAEGDVRLRALVQNDLAVMAAMDKRFEEASRGWHAALEIDRDCLVARLNRDLVEAEIRSIQTTDDSGELKLAPAPPALPSPLVGEGGPQGRMGGGFSHRQADPHPPFGRPLPWGEVDQSGAGYHSLGAR
jgi:hypothetical protein